MPHPRDGAIIGVTMVNRPRRFEIDRPIEFRLADSRDAPRLYGRTVNISTGGVLIQTDQNIPVGRKVEMVVRMEKLAPDSADVDLRLYGVTVRSGDGWVAAQVRKHQLLPHIG